MEENGKKGTYIEIYPPILKDIKEYCKINNLKLTEYINELLKKGLIREKFGDKPPIFNTIKEIENKIEVSTIEKTEEENKGEVIEEKVKKETKRVRNIKTY